MREPGKRGVLVISIFVLAGLITYLLLARISAENRFLKLTKEYSALTERFSDLQEEYSNYRGNSSFTIDGLKDNISSVSSKMNSLNNTLREMEKDYSQLREKHDSLKDEMEDTLSEIKYYEKDLEDSMAWFSHNSALSSINSRVNEEKISDYLNEDCVSISNKVCMINTGCINLVNTQFMGYTYKPDSITSGKTDYLQSLGDFVKNKGGDCEDFSLFFKAEYNYLLEKCDAEDALAVELVTWVQDPGSEKTYLDFKNDWFRTLAREKRISSYKYPNVVCGRLYDLNTQEINGHCVVAMTKKEIKSQEDMIALLRNAVLIEPQDGSFKGYIDDDSSDVLLPRGGDYDESGSYIFEVITDNDLFLLSQKHREWLSYDSLLNTLQGYESRLLEIA